MSNTRIHPLYIAPLKKLQEGPKLGSIPIEQYRSLKDQQAAAFPLPDVLSEDITVSAKDGRDLHLTILRPLGTEAKVLPVVIYYHGGGWVFGSKQTHGKIIRDICIQARAAVIFVDYVLAPAAKFPAIHEEAFSALQWVVENGRGRLGIDVDRLAVCGDSAGGNLAAAMAIMAKERGLQDAIKAQILIYPSTSPKPVFPSYLEFGTEDFMLSNEDIRYFGTAYYSKAMRNSKYMYALLASQEDLQDLPPALVLTAEADVLRDEGEEYARRLTDAGVKTVAVRLIGSMAM
ncbi:Alpha/Beta hydrolase protein [Dichotomocladium elegans]|nr:Alpha/Beta hydrolase protein [Dichotomocladium elegans]